MRLKEGTDDMPAELTELRVGDVAIKLHRAGRGPTVLFLHGAGGVPQWLSFFDALAERYEVRCPSIPALAAPTIRHGSTRSRTSPCSISTSSRRRGSTGSI